MTSVKRKEPEAETKAAGGSITLNDMQIASLPPRAKRGRRNNRRGENDIGEEDADAPAASDDAPAAADASDKGAGAGAGSAAESKEAKSDESKKAAKNWEYLDHTADIQLHSWGSSLIEAFEAQAIAMFSYMTDLDTVEIDDSLTQTWEIEGHDMQSLLYNYLDEFLYRFSTDDFFVPKEVKILELKAKDTFSIKVQARGEQFTLDKHPQGTEVKAITYSNMQIIEKAAEKDKPARVDVFVIIDI